MNTTRKLEMLWQQRIWNKRKMYMTLTVVWHDVVLIANPVTWFTITIQYFIIHSDYQKMYSPPGRIRNSFPPPYHISAKLYSPLYQICLFSVPPLKIHFPPTHRKNDRSLKEAPHRNPDTSQQPLASKWIALSST